MRQERAVASADLLGHLAELRRRECPRNLSGHRWKGLRSRRRALRLGEYVRAAVRERRREPWCNPAKRLRRLARRVGNLLQGRIRDVAGTLWDRRFEEISYRLP